MWLGRRLTEGPELPSYTDLWPVPWPPSPRELAEAENDDWTPQALRRRQ